MRVRCWNEQHRTHRSLYDAVGDRPESKTREADRLMGAEHDEIRGVSSCVQQNHAPQCRPVERGPSLERSGLRHVYAVPPGPTPVPWRPNCSVVLRHRVHKDELCPVTHAHGESLLKGRRGRSRCIDCAQNPKRVSTVLLLRRDARSGHDPAHCSAVDYKCKPNSE